MGSGLIRTTTDAWTLGITWLCAVLALAAGVWAARKGRHRD